jgi:hypothetical protein
MDQADVQRRIEHALAKSGGNPRSSISSNSRIPSLKRERSPGQEVRGGAPPKSVQKMTDHISVQQAWSILQAHGMNSTQLEHLHAQALAMENMKLSRGHIELKKPKSYEDFVDKANNQESPDLGPTTPVARQDTPPAVQATSNSLLSDTEQLALAAKEQRLVALVTQLISEYGFRLPNVETYLNLAISVALAKYIYRNNFNSITLALPVIVMTNNVFKMPTEVLSARIEDLNLIRVPQLNNPLLRRMNRLLKTNLFSYAIQPQQITLKAIRISNLISRARTVLQVAMWQHNYKRQSKTFSRNSVNFKRQPTWNQNFLLGPLCCTESTVNVARMIDYVQFKYLPARAFF